MGYHKAAKLVEYVRKITIMSIWEKKKKDFPTDKKIWWFFCHFHGSLLFLSSGVDSSCILILEPWSRCSIGSLSHKHLWGSSLVFFHILTPGRIPHMWYSILIKVCRNWTLARGSLTLPFLVFIYLGINEDEDNQSLGSPQEEVLIPYLCL